MSETGVSKNLVSQKPKGEFCCGQCRWKHRNEISATKSKLNKKSRKTESQNELATVALKRMQKYIRDKQIRDVAALPLSCVDNPFGKLRNLLGERFDVSVIIERLWNEPAESLVKTLPARVNTALSKSF